jgi:ABC-type branched-subunit amino acid transport system ATPase component/ABC-type branched-subunit amino acid transport system permease subunit
MLATWISQQIVLDGVIQGFVYGLLAMSIVLVYRSTKVINFAVGNMGLVGAGLLVICDVNYGFPFWISLLIALLAGTVYGGVIELVVIRRLFRAPRVIVLVATIGVAQLSLAVLNAYPDLIGKGKRFPQAVGSVWNIADFRLKGSQVLILLAAPILAFVLGWFLNRTLLGRTVKASSGNADLARLHGISPKIVSTFVWALSGLIGTISMVLIGGLEGSASSLQALGPNTLLRALVAAVIARLTSFRTALLAALAIGLGQSILRFNFLAQPGLVDLLLLVVVLVAVWLQSRHGSTEQEGAFSFTPRVEAIPERLKSIFWVRHLERFVLLAMLGVAVVLPLVITQPSRQLLYAVIAAYAICALSLTVLTGWAGQLSLGQMAFAGIGAFTAAALTRGLKVDWQVGGTQLIDVELYGLPFALSIVIGALLTTLLSVLIGAGALRVRGLLLAVTTFAFAIAAQSWMYRLDVLSGGSASLVSFPRGELFGLDLKNQRTYYYVVLTVLVLVMALLGRLRRSGVGRVTIAVRDNADSAASYTVRPAFTKLRAFALSGFLAGLGGGLLAGASQQISFSESPFVVGVSLSLVAMIVIGGMSSTVGAVIGAVWVIGLPAMFPDSDLIPLLSSSLGLLVLLLYFPGGFVQVAYNARSGIYRWMERRLPPLEKSAIAPPAAIGAGRQAEAPPQVALRTTDVSVSFGGVKANDDVSIEVRGGEIVGLIGTNGAGKSTLMNAIGGFVPSHGSVDLLGQDISGLPPALRARRGLGRTFQAATLFPELTVRETVEVALEARGRTGLLSVALFSPRARTREGAKRADAADLVDFLGLGRYADKPIAELSTGTRRIVELAGLLALDARVLCLDEPTAGVAQREAEAMGPLLVEIRQQLGASMLVIEHDMPLIMGMSDRVYCLELGRVIAEGPPDAVRNDPAVVASYLGTDERTIARSGAVADAPPGPAGPSDPGSPAGVVAP